MKYLFLSLILASCLLLVASGCAQRSCLSPSLSNLSSMKPPLGPDEIFRLDRGDQISFGELLNHLGTTSVIFIGESHDQVEHHQIQQRVIIGLMERKKEVVVAMEMFRKSQQPILDRWSHGLLSEDEFLKEVDWENTWGMDYRLYKEILDGVKTFRLKLLGLNVERDLIREVAQNGIEGLPHGEQEKLPSMNLRDPGHRAYIESIYKDHQEGLAKELEKFYQAQVLWDEAMAEALSRFILSPEGKNKTVLVLAGRGHVIFNFGIPNRFYRRSSVPYKTILLQEWKKGIEEDLNFPGSRSPAADYLWVTNPTPPQKGRPRIGIVLKEKGEPPGVWIERVLPQSPAEKAGLLSEDQILSIDGNVIKGLKDVHHAVAGKGWGRDISVTILRGEVKKETTVTLPPHEDLNPRFHPPLSK